MSLLEKAFFVTNKGRIIPYSLEQVAALTPDTAVDFIATENISQYDVVTSKGKRADTADYNTRNIIIGFATTNVLNGFPGKAVGFGQIANAAWTWVKGDKIFLNGLGTVNTLPPISTYSVLLGTATDTITVDVNIQPSLLL